MLVDNKCYKMKQGEGHFIRRNQQSMSPENYEINLVQLLLDLSASLDFSMDGLSNHHKRVTLISLRIGEAIGLDQDEILNLFTAAVIHDIGAVTWRDRQKLKQFHVTDPWHHCQLGHQFLKGVYTIELAADLIFSHHDRWIGNNPSGLEGDSIPLISRIINVSDRMDVLCKSDMFILDQRNDILKKINEFSGEIFDPDLVAVLNDICKKEEFWLNLVSPWVEKRIIPLIPYNPKNMEIENLRDIAQLYARIVDSKSPFTHRHSRGIASIAKLLAEQAGFAQKELDLIEVAGLLHDLGKLSVSEEIIMKPGALTEKEFNQIKQHTYYTYWLLKPATPNLPLAEWAAYHHERIDGQGYPFRKLGCELDTGSRLMSIADIFTALREDRPYRKALEWAEIETIIHKQVLGGALDGDLALLFFENRGKIDDLWEELSSVLP